MNLNALRIGTPVPLRNGSQKRKMLQQTAALPAAKTKRILFSKHVRAAPDHATGKKTWWVEPARWDYNTGARVVQFIYSKPTTKTKGVRFSRAVFRQFPFSSLPIAWKERPPEREKVEGAREGKLRSATYVALRG